MSNVWLQLLAGLYPSIHPSSILLQVKSKPLRPTVMPVPNHLVPCSHANPCYSSSSRLITSRLISSHPSPASSAHVLRLFRLTHTCPTRCRCYPRHPSATHRRPRKREKKGEEVKNKELVEMERVWGEAFGFFYLASSVDDAVDQGAGIEVQQDLILRCLLSPFPWYSLVAVFVLVLPRCCNVPPVMSSIPRCSCHIRHGN